MEQPMIMVTGGAGFIGSNLVARLEAEGRAVLVCDRLGTEEKWRNLGKRELVELCPPEGLFSTLDAYADAVEAVLHMGAISSTTETDADRVIETNFRRSLDLWHWCARRGVPLLYASSGATYGDGSAGFVASRDPEALARLRPLNLYGWSKHLFDRRAARLAAEGGPAPPQWAGLKFFNVYGPNEYHKGAMQSVVAQLWPRIAAGEPARLFRSHHPDYPDGGQLRDFVWVGDCVDVVCWLLANPRVSGIFNVGAGQARSFADLARAAMRAAGREPEIEYVEMPAHLRARYQYFTEAELSGLREVGYDRPMTSLEEGVTTYIQRYLSAADPYA
jgi:ADP-L-glycero-D-manno-heptose 6-epimerase